MPFKSLITNALKLIFLQKNNCTHFYAHFAQGAEATAMVAARLCGATVSLIAVKNKPLNFHRLLSNIGNGSTR
jgi:hypothetical protein